MSGSKPEVVGSIPTGPAKILRKPVVNRYIPQMRAIRYYSYLSEWRVELDERWIQREDFRRIKRWITLNCERPVYDENYRISADAGVVAFLTEEDAQLFYIAFA